MRNMENEAFFSSVLNIKIGENSQPVILKDVQMHPWKSMVLHLDMQRILADEKIRMSVPIHFLNEDTAVGVKLRSGTVLHMMTEVDITCLPADLPEYLAIDIGELDLDETLYLSDLKLPSGVEIPELTQSAENDRGIVSIHVIKEVQEVEEVAEGEAVAGAEGAPEGAAAEPPKEEGDDKSD